LAHKATTASSAGTASDITIDDIRAAAKVIDGIVERTPTHFSRTLSKIAGCEIWLKFENLQFTASFKERGALNKLTSLNAEQRKRGVVAMSAGNHAQGVAYHAGRLGIPATIVMPEGTPFNKVKHTKNFGARVVLDGMTLMQASDRAHVIEKEEGLTFVHPYDDPLIIAGQGTIGTEIVEDLAALGLAPEIVVIGASGGGLAAGVSLGVKARVPAAKFYTVEPEGFDDTARSFKSGKREANPRLSGSICDALMSNTPGELTFPITQALIGEGLVVSDAEVARAVRYAFEELKLAVEPGGVIGLAALLAGKLDVRGKVVVGVLSGGNIDAELFAKIIGE